MQGLILNLSRRFRSAFLAHAFLALPAALVTALSLITLLAAGPAADEGQAAAAPLPLNGDALLLSTDARTALDLPGAAEMPAGQPAAVEQSRFLIGAAAPAPDSIPGINFDRQGDDLGRRATAVDDRDDGVDDDGVDDDADRSGPTPVISLDRDDNRGQGNGGQDRSGEDRGGSNRGDDHDDDDDDDGDDDDDDDDDDQGEDEDDDD